MSDVVEMMNRHVPVPTPDRRRRLWIEVGQLVAWRGDVMLSVERQRDGDEHTLVLQFASRDGAAALPATQMIRIGAVAIVPRALAWRDGVPVAVMLELAAEPHDLALAIEAAA